MYDPTHHEGLLLGLHNVRADRRVGQKRPLLHLVQSEQEQHHVHPCQFLTGQLG